MAILANAISYSRIPHFLKLQKWPSSTYTNIPFTSFTFPSPSTLAFQCLLPTLIVGDTFDTGDLLKQAYREYAFHHTFEYTTMTRDANNVNRIFALMCTCWRAIFAISKRARPFLEIRETRGLQTRESSARRLVWPEALGFQAV